MSGQSQHPTPKGSQSPLTAGDRREPVVFPQRGRTDREAVPRQITHTESKSIRDHSEQTHLLPSTLQIEFKSIAIKPHGLLPS